MKKLVFLMPYQEFASRRHGQEAFQKLIKWMLKNDEEYAFCDVGIWIKR